MRRPLGKHKLLRTNRALVNGEKKKAISIIAEIMIVDPDQDHFSDRLMQDLFWETRYFRNTTDTNKLPMIKLLILTKMSSKNV